MKVPFWCGMGTVGGAAYVGTGAYGNSVPFCCKPKTALKIIFKREKDITNTSQMTNNCIKESQHNFSLENCKLKQQQDANIHSLGWQK